MPVLYSLHRIVEEAAGGRELVFDIGQIGLQLLEVRVGLQIRIVLRQGEQLPQRAAENIFSRHFLFDTGCRNRGVARRTTASRVPRSCAAYPRQSL